MNAKQVIQTDNLDDRREIVQILARLSPARRMAFLDWACKQATMPGSCLHPRPARKTLEVARIARWDSSANERLTVEVYMDIWYLSMQYDFDLSKALKRLVQEVRVSHS